MRQKIYADAAALAKDKKITIEAAEHIFRHFGPTATSCHAAVRQLLTGNVAFGEYPMPTKDQLKRRSNGTGVVVLRRVRCRKAIVGQRSGESEFSSEILAPFPDVETEEVPLIRVIAKVRL